ncbi:MAG: murein transglycosylase, partial [Steroidobacteraceae bacterium]
MPQPTFTPMPFAQLPGWARDDLRDAFAAFRAGCVTLKTRVPWQGACAQQVQEGASPAPAAIRAFFERWFQPWQITTTEASGARVDAGMVTGYYEPQLRGSRKREGAYTIPL